MLGAPVYGRLALQLADDPTLAAAILGDDESWDVGLRLFGAVHNLVLRGIAPEALDGGWEPFAHALTAHRDELTAFVRTQGVQTNETQRCVALLPCFLTIAAETGLPLELLELGPSAGLNLLVDRYAYTYRNGSFGSDTAHLRFDAVERHPVPAAIFETARAASDNLSQAGFRVRRRLGIDLAPVDATTEAGATLLRSFVWPGREDRLTRLDAAIATLREEPDRPELVRGNYVELLPELLADRADDAITVVFQTASTGYLSPEDRVTLRRRLDDAGSDGRPLAWISTRARDEREHEETDGWELELRVWPGPARLAAFVDYHGNWLDWRL